MTVWYIWYNYSKSVRVIWRELKGSLFLGFLVLDASVRCTRDTAAHVPRISKYRNFEYEGKNNFSCFKTMVDVHS